MEHYVYVLDKDGKPLMPTTRYRKVRLMLKNGQAKAVRTKPFTIQLNYETETHIVQPVRIAEDCGRTNIGLAAIREDGKCLYRSKTETRNKKIPALMGKRKVHRQASRRGERLARKRLAKRYHTTMKRDLFRHLPGYKEGNVCVKDIRNTEARFNNRARPAGWLTPTATQLLRTHENLIQDIRRILPISSVAIEINKFDFQRLDNPHIKRTEYGKGQLHGYGSVRAALSAQQDGVCLLCKKRPIEHDHHLIPRSKRGSDTLPNMAGLCLKCHDLVHKDAKKAALLSKRKKGITKKYAGASVLNQIIGDLTDWCAKEFPDNAFVTTGKGTHDFREEHCLEKDHDIDAYCIGAVTMNDVKVDQNMPPCYLIKQYRRHDRARIKSQTSRTYLWEGTKVAANRRKACECTITKDGKIKWKQQTLPSLEDWYAAMVKKHGQKATDLMRSRLTVKKSQRRMNRMDRLLPGATFVYEGKRYVMSGQITLGQYFQAEGCDAQNFPVSQCTHIIPNRGLVYL